MNPQDPRSPSQQQRALEIMNIGTHTIPAHGACEVMGTTRVDSDRMMLLVRRPTKDSAPTIIFNGMLPVTAGRIGYATNDHPAFAMGYVPVGESCGSTKDSFSLATGKIGFTSLGIDPVSGLTRVKEAGGGQASELEFVELTTSLSLGSFGRAKLLTFDTATGEFAMTGDEFRVQDYTRDSTHEPGDLIGAVGYRGWARRPRNEAIEDENGDDVPVWPLVRLEQIAEIIRGALTDNMTETTTDLGSGPVGTGLWRSPSSVADWFDGKNPGTTQNLYDPAGLFKRALSGAKFVARRNNRAGADDANGGSSGNPRGRYEAVECQTKAGFVSGTLTQTRFGPGAPPGNIWKIQVTDGSWWGSQQDVQDPRDQNGQVSVYFEFWEFPYAYAGAQGTYAYDAESDLYYPVEVDQMALAIRFSLLNPLCSDYVLEQPGTIGASFTSMTPFPFSRPPDGFCIVPIRNSKNHAGEIGDECFAILDAENGCYEIINAPLKEVESFSDLRLFNDSLGNDCSKLQGKVIKIRAESCEASTPVWRDTAVRMMQMNFVTQVELVSTPFIPAVPAEGETPEIPEVPATCIVKKTRQKACVFSTEITAVDEDGEITGYSDGLPAITSTVFEFQSTQVMVNAFEATDEITGTLAYVWTGPCDPEKADEDFTIAEIGDCPEEEPPP